MDRVALLVLHREIQADSQLAAEAADLAAERFAGRQQRDLEAAAFQLVRCYNAIEQAGLHLAKAFENEIDDEGRWHAEWMRRLTLDIPEIRPALFTEEDLAHLRELRGFRHLVVHAYDLTLDTSRVERMVGHARQVSELLPRRISTFFEVVRPSPEEES